MTVQRRSVAEVLSHPDIHLTADEIYRRVRESIPEIARATVYNALGELVAMGEVAEVQLAPGATRFDPNAPTLHHHLVCERCGQIHDVHPTGLQHIELPAEERRGFELRRVQLTFRGVCAECAGKAADSR